MEKYLKFTTACTPTSAERTFSLMRRLLHPAEKWTRSLAVVGKYSLSAAVWQLARHDVAPSLKWLWKLATKYRAVFTWSHGSAQWCMGVKEVYPQREASLLAELDAKAGRAIKIVSGS